MSDGEDPVAAESIADEFPGWEAWQGIDRLWDARVRGATPPIMVYAEDLVDLPDQVKRTLAKTEERSPRSEDSTL